MVVSNIEAAVLQNILKIISYNFFLISLQIYIRVVRNKKLHMVTFLLIKTDNSLFCHRDIPTIQYITATALVTQ